MLVTCPVIIFGRELTRRSSHELYLIGFLRPPSSAAPGGGGLGKRRRHGESQRCRRHNRWPCRCGRRTHCCFIAVGLSRATTFPLSCGARLGVRSHHRFPSCAGVSSHHSFRRRHGRVCVLLLHSLGLDNLVWHVYGEMVCHPILHRHGNEVTLILNIRFLSSSPSQSLSKGL